MKDAKLEFLEMVDEHPSIREGKMNPEPCTEMEEDLSPYGEDLFTIDVDGRITEDTVKEAINTDFYMDREIIFFDYSCSDLSYYSLHCVPVKSYLDSDIVMSTGLSRMIMGVMSLHSITCSSMYSGGAWAIFDDPDFQTEPVGDIISVIDHMDRLFLSLDQ